MSDSYTKLMRSLVASTIVEEPIATRWLWVVMMSQADAKGRVYASIPGLARIANISLAECETALERFQAPDKYSRTQDFDGRRIRTIDGGWDLINHAKYSKTRNAEERNEYMAEHMREKRNKEKEANVSAVSKPLAPVSSVSSVSSELAPVSSVSSELAELAVLAPLALTPALTLTLTPTPKEQEQEQKQRAPEIPPGALATKAMIDAGLDPTRCNPSDPRLAAALAEGVTPQMLADITARAIALKTSVNQAWVVATARGQLADSRLPIVPSGQAPGQVKKSNAVQPSAPGTYGDDDPLPDILK